jgi:hypothetical protein
MTMKSKAIFITPFFLFSFGMLSAQVLVKKWDKRGIKPPSQFSIASLNNKWGLVDDSNNIKVLFIYDSINYNQFEFHFITYKNGKVGLISQYGTNLDTIIAGITQIINIVEPAFDSISPIGVLKCYRNDSMAIYAYDGGLLFPFSPVKEICSFMTRPHKKNAKNPYKVEKQNEKLFEKDSSYALIRELIFFYKNKYYRRKIQQFPYTAPDKIEPVKLSKDFKQQIKEDGIMKCEGWIMYK